LKLLKNRPFEEFDPGCKDKDLAEKRYEAYMKRLVKTINKIMFERHRISIL